MRTWLPIAFSVLLVSTATAQHDHGDGHDDAYFDSGSSSDASDWMAPNDTFEFTFDITHGSFDYHCHPHPWMEGTVIVKGEAMDHDAMSGMEHATHTVRIVEGDATDIDSWVFEPQTITIQLGDTVKWVNQGDMQHTVTASEPAPHAHNHDSPAIGTLVVLGILACLVTVFRR